MNDRVHKENERALELVSFYLNYIPDHIDRETVDSIVGESTDMRDYAFSAIMAAACGLDAYENAEDKQLFRKYFVPMVKGLRADEYRSDLYYKNMQQSSFCANTALTAGIVLIPVCATTLTSGIILTVIYQKLKMEHLPKVAFGFVPNQGCLIQFSVPFKG